MCVSIYKIQKGTHICKGKKDMKKISLWGKKKNISRNNGDFKVRKIWTQHNETNQLAHT